MFEVLRVTFPFFALVLCGYAAARKGLLPLEAIPGLNGFVLFFALPCMLFRFGASTPIDQLLDAGVFFTYLLCALLMVAFSVAISLNERIRWNDASLGALVAAFPNTGFMGVPLLVALLGPEAAGPAIVTILVDMVITSSLCVALSRMDAAGEHGVAGAARKALAGVVRNPMPWAISLGGALSFWNLELIGPVAKTVGLLADAASPVGARGLMQLMPATAKELGVKNSFDSHSNILAGSAYLAKLLKNYQGDISLASAAYNAGPGAVQKYAGIPPYAETKAYVKRVQILFQRYRSQLATTAHSTG